MRRTIALTISGLLHTAAVLAAVLLRAPLGVPVESDEIVVEHVTLGAVPEPDQVLPTPPDTAPTDRRFEVSMRRLDDFAFDLAKIRDRANSLFPFLTLDLMFLDRVPGDLRAAQERLTNPLAAGVNGGSAPPLELTDAAAQELTDRAWSRRERWKHFGEIAALLSSRHPGRGRAPDLVRMYLDQNILQPYCDGDRHDPRFWAMLENAADHADFIDFIRSFTRRHPSSRTTTELLFLLDELTQGSRDVLLMLMETRPDEHLTFTRTHAPDGYALAVALKDRYGRWLLERGLDKVAVRRRYDEVRLRLLNTIIETTPDNYRAADAKYLAGEVLFDMNRAGDAGRIWRSIRPVETDAYHRAYTELVEELDSGAADARRVRRILSAEYGRWRVFSIDRLRRFGHYCDTF